MSRSTLPALIVAAFIASGCETSSLGPRDSSPVPPHVASPGVTPGTVNIDTLVPAGGTYEITLAASVLAFDADGWGDLSTVRAEVLRPGEGSAFAQFLLHDDGASPDAAAGDSLFSGSIVFTARRSDAGLHRVRFLAQDRSGLRSPALEATCNVIRNNARPRLDSLSLAAPDTLRRPASGSLLFRVSISASDSDGLSDIQRVFMENLATLTRFSLLDDGGAPQPGGITSGDSLAGDGIFSITFGLPSTASPGVLNYRLQAVDAVTDTSASVPYTLVVE